MWCLPVGKARWPASSMAWWCTTRPLAGCGLRRLKATAARRVSTLTSARVKHKYFPDEVIEALIKKGDIFTTAGGMVAATSGCYGEVQAVKVEDESLQPFRDTLEAFGSAFIELQNARALWSRCRVYLLNRYVACWSGQRLL